MFVILVTVHLSLYKNRRNFTGEKRTGTSK